MIDVDAQNTVSDAEPPNSDVTGENPTEGSSGRTAQAETCTARECSEEVAAVAATTTEPDPDTVRADAEEGGEPVSAREQRYRQRAQASEAERDRLAALVEDMRSAEIQRLVSERLADPSDLFRDGATVEDLLDEHGHVDATRLNAAVARLLAAHPHWAAPLGRYRGPLLSGASQGKLVETPLEPWQSAFGPKVD